MNVKPAVISDRISLFLRVIIAIGVVIAIFLHLWLDAFLISCIFLLSLFPVFMEKRLRIHIPPEFELLAVFFIFASLFLGEIRGYYARYWWWDAALHTGSGLLLGILGFLLVYILNEDDRIHFSMKPIFVAMFAFAFAVAVGALWEIFEFTMDGTFGLNMQKSGLVDTMWDLIVDSVGALVVSFMGYLYLQRGVKSFMVDWVASFIQGNPQMFNKNKKD